MLLLSLWPDGLLTIPGMALSIDSMRFVSSAHATLATGVLTFTLVGLLPLNTSAFLLDMRLGVPLPSTRESELVIMIAWLMEEDSSWK
jgi:hypothetical protein